MPEPTSAGRSQLRTREGSDALPASFMMRASSRSARLRSVAVHLHPSPSASVRLIALADRCSETAAWRSGGSASARAARRSSNGGSAACRRRIAVDLVLQTRERLAFLAIPVVSIGAHVSCTPCALRNRVNAYCRCPLTCISRQSGAHGDFRARHPLHIAQRQADPMHLFEVRALEQPALDGRRFGLGRGHELFGIASLHHLTPPPVTGPISDHGQQPSGQLDSGRSRPDSDGARGTPLRSDLQPPHVSRRR